MERDRGSATLQRYVIKRVADGQYGNELRMPERVCTPCPFMDFSSDSIQTLSVTCEKTKNSRVILLRQHWIDTPCTPGAYVHVIGDFDRYGQCIVDNAQNMLILHPDHLISSTVVGDSFTCIRKSVLQDRVKATSDPNQSLVYGHILHEIFQEALRYNGWDDDFMDKTIRSTVTNHLEAIYEINIEHAAAVDQLKGRITDLQAWARIFVAAKPKVSFMEVRLYTSDLT